MNVGVPRTTTWQGREVRSAIWTDPVGGPHRVGGVDVVGDDRAERRR
ncbi:MAG: hypothetical protein AAFZ07_10150 [Actinomycetota bacterium]